MKYLLFAGATYYPGGGWNDFRGEFATLEEAEVAATDFDWWQIVSRNNGVFKRESGSNCPIGKGTFANIS